MSANIGSSTLALLGQVKSHDTCYTRTVSGYLGSSRPVTQIIRVCEHGSGHVKIDLFVDGNFAGTWVKSTAHFANIIRWGSWVHVKAGTALARMRIPSDEACALLSAALKQAAFKWIGEEKA